MTSIIPSTCTRWLAASVMLFAWLGLAETASAQFQVTTAEVLDLELEDGNTDTSNSRYTVNIQDCATHVEDNTDITFRWTFNITAPSNTKYAIKLQPPGASCTFTSTTIDGDQEGCRLIAASDDLSGSSVSLDIAMQNLLGFADANACLTEGVDSGDYIMGLIYTNPNDTTAGDDANDYVNEPIEVTLRLSRPAEPTLDEVSAGESTISASWTSNVESIDEYQVFYSTNELIEGTIPEAVSASNASALATSLDISSGVEVNRTYYVGVVNVDEYGNRSPLSNVLDVQTAPTLDFFEEYLSAGGTEQGGYCSAAPASDALPAASALVLLVLVAGRRRSNRADRHPVSAGARTALFASLSAGALTFAPAPASAEITLDTPEIGFNAIEVRISRFNPDIDSEFDGATPYADTFDGARPYNLEIEYDRQFYEGFGSFGVGFNLGYNRVRGSARTVDGETSPDKTRLLVVPTRVSAVYRFDELPQRFNIPFTFVFKVGLDYAFWSIGDSEGQTAEVPTDSGDPISGRGGTAGWHASAGLHLLLDWFSPNMASSFASNVGVVDSYLFVEFMASQVDDFGSSTSWSLSQQQLWVGLAFEF